jgi:hypothetical protein
VTDPITTPDELNTALGQTIDYDRASLLIELAQEMCETVVSPLPATARGVVIGVAVRALLNPGNVASEGAGPFNTSFGNAAAGGLYLTKQDRATLLRLAGRGGAFTVDPTPADAGQNLPAWDRNITWPSGVPLLDQQPNP